MLQSIKDHFRQLLRLLLQLNFIQTMRDNKQSEKNKILPTSGSGSETGCGGGET
jgi:hypothetical protein